METRTQEKQTDVLFTQALNVMNQALNNHRDETPYRQILGAAQRLLDERTFAVGVYKTDPGKPFDYYTVRYHENRIELVEHGKNKDADLDWKVSREYLERVAANPERYIDHPEKLDFDWLQSRLGL